MNATTPTAQEADPQEADPVRSLLVRLIAERKLGLAPVSLAIGQNRAYLQQFLKRGRPRNLPSAARFALARFFGIDEQEFRPPEDRGPSEGLDPELMQRAYTIARRLIGNEPKDEWLRIEGASCLYTLLQLLQRGMALDDEAVLRVIELLIRRVWRR